MSQTCGPDATPGTAADFEHLFADDELLRGLGYAARRLLAMSAALFYRNGAAATSIRDITSACGLSPGAMYKHFASKDDLLDVLVTYGHDRIEQRIAHALHAAGPDPTRQLCAFVHAHVSAHLERPELAQLVRREYLHLSPERHHGIVGRRRRLRQQLADILVAGQACGHFAVIDSDTDPEATTHAAVMMLDAGSRTSEWYHPRPAHQSDVLAQRYVTAALRLAGVAPESPTGRVKRRR